MIVLATSPLNPVPVEPANLFLACASLWLRPIPRCSQAQHPREDLRLPPFVMLHRLPSEKIRVRTKGHSGAPRPCKPRDSWTTSQDAALAAKVGTSSMI